MEILAQVFPWDLMSFKGGEPVDIIICGDEMETHLKDSEAELIFLTDITDNDQMKEKLEKVLKKKGELPM